MRHPSDFYFRKTSLALAVAGLCSALNAAAPAGGEFRVNTNTLGDQSDHDIASDANGNFVVVWTDNNNGAGLDVLGQRYFAGGAKRGAEFMVASLTTRDQNHPAVAMNADGSFVVVWTGFNFDENSDNIYARQFGSNGAALADEFLVNTFTTHIQTLADVAVDGGGDFVVVWDSQNQEDSFSGVYGQRYSALGAPQDLEFRANVYNTSYQQNPTVAMDADGDFVVAWESAGQDGSYLGIYARRYSAAGVGSGEFKVNTHTGGEQRFPDVAMDADGDFVIVWGGDGNNGNGYDIYASRRDALGVALGDEFRVNTRSSGSQSNPAVAMDSTGAFSVVWVDGDQDGSGLGIYGQSFSATGTADGGEFRVNTTTNNSQLDPSIASDANGDLRVAWSSFGQDGSSFGVYAQRFSCAGVLALSGATASVNEGVASGKKPLAVSRSGGSCGAVSVSYETVDGSAKSGADYTAKTGTLNWADGVDGNKSFSVDITNDLLDEPNETFKAKILTPAGGAVLGAVKQQTVTITDNDPKPAVAFAAPSSAVGEGNVKNVTLTLSAASGQTVTVPLTVAGSADGSDYTLSTIPVIFNPGVISKAVKVTTIEDAATESNETVSLTIGAPTNATKGSPSAHTVTINDDD